MPDLRIGTSGWIYKDWRGRLYPPDLPARRWFEFYAREFWTVEINNTFYLPCREVARLGGPDPRVPLDRP